MHRAAWMVVVAMGLCGRGQAQERAPDGREAAASTVVHETRYFGFHSDPWINLHHFLYQWAREDQGLASGRQYVEVSERTTLKGLPREHRQAWLWALSLYRQSVAARSLFEDALLNQKMALLELRGDPDMRPPDAVPGISVALATAMPVYLEHWWPDHDRANRQWIENVVPYARRHEGRYVELTERVYGSDWSGGPRRIDASAYANSRGGYTAVGHAIIYSTGPGIRDLYALEILVHEVQHTRDIGGPARVRLAGAFEEAGVDQPRNLWHSLIFATAGAFVQGAAERDGLPTHEPYWIREGFEGFRGWGPLVPVVQEHWVPVVRGESTTEEGFRALVDSFREG